MKINGFYSFIAAPASRPLRTLEHGDSCATSLFPQPGLWGIRPPRCKGEEIVAAAAAAQGRMDAMRQSEKEAPPTKHPSPAATDKIGERVI